MPTQCACCLGSNRDGAQFCARCGAPIVLAGRYQIRGRLGQGGMATVYQATDLHLPTTVIAVKEMIDSAIDPADRRRALADFEREARILAGLNHPNIPKVSDFFSQGSKHYLVMEYVDGSSLEELLQARGCRPFSESEVRPWIVQLCSALAYLHARRPPVIFRDLKPHNIMLDRAGHIKLVDFGIARFFDPTKATDTTNLGTTGYAAPEQFGQKQSDERTDIYALGATLHRLLTGCDPTQTPFSLPPIRTMAPGLSPAMEQIVNYSLAPQPLDRWQSIVQMQAVLQPQQPPVGLPPPMYGAAAPAPSGYASAAAAPRMQSPSRPTTRLIQTMVRLTGQQLALAIGAFLLVVFFSVWLLAPLIQERAPLLWNNFPLFVIGGPLAYAAFRRRGAGLAGHVAVTLTGWLTWWARSGAWPADMAAFLVATVLSGIVFELGMNFLPQVKGPSGDDAWLRECGWFAFCAAIAVIILYALWFSLASGLRPGLWIGAALVGLLGWFLGDSLQQWLILRQTGMRRPQRP